MDLRAFFVCVCFSEIKLVKIALLKHLGSSRFEMLGTGGVLGLPRLGGRTEGRTRDTYISILKNRYRYVRIV